MRNSRMTIFWVGLIVLVLAVAIGTGVFKQFETAGQGYSFRDEMIVDLGVSPTRISERKNVILKNESDYQKYFGEASDEDLVDFGNYHYAVAMTIVDNCEISNLQPSKHSVDGQTISMMVEYTAGCGECQEQYQYYLIPIDKSITEGVVEVNTRAVNQVECPTEE